MGDPADQEALACAQAMAQRMRSHIVGLHVRSPISMATTGGMFEGAYMSPELLDALEESRRTAAAKARDVFDRWREASAIPLTASPGGTAAVSTEWHDVEAPVAGEIGRWGRTADVTVLARTARDYAPATDEALQGALFESGRPVLLVPGAQPVGPFETVVIAWNDSREAAHAVAAAWSLLGRARRTVIFVGGEDEALRRAADRFAAHLAWRGYAPPSVVADASEDVGDGLLSVAGGERAGLIVMGAYTHSRLRQLVFGGATSHVLKRTAIPVLMAH
ncbi:MAG: universal stress protein [Alphaproteobacteria bacterium]|nr:universal stress protein [Alphaproteobacteria bacterium]